jgi:hypothetical protein
MPLKAFEPLARPDTKGIGAMDMGIEGGPVYPVPECYHTRTVDQRVPVDEIRGGKEVDYVVVSLEPV